METIERIAIARSTVDPRQIRTGDQHCLTILPHPYLVLCILAAVHACGTQHHELGNSDVWWGDHLEFDLLFCLGQAHIHRPSVGGQARLLVSGYSIHRKERANEAAESEEAMLLGVSRHCIP